MLYEFFFPPQALARAGQMLKKKFSVPLGYV
jgi:hypothetical protein